jgi:hypothetical protein
MLESRDSLRGGSVNSAAESSVKREAFGIAGTEPCIRPIHDGVSEQRVILLTAMHDNRTEGRVTPRRHPTPQQHPIVAAVMRVKIIA